MKFLIIPGLVVCFLSCGVASETYRAGIVRYAENVDLEKYVPRIHEASKLNVDIVVLPSPLSFLPRTSTESYGADNYDELVQILSEAAQQAGVYVAAHLLEKTRCQGRYEMVRSNLVFGRDGRVVTVYRKPVNNVANCTAPATEIATFTTDFGVEFGLLMEEDLVLHKVEDMKGLKNFVVVGPYASDVPMFTGPQFSSSWAFTNDVNLVSPSGMFAGTSGTQGRSEAGLTIADLNKAGAEGSSTIPPVVSSSDLKVFPAEDLSQYMVRPLDVAASARGYKETVCSNGFCCNFFVKASFDGAKDDTMSYGLAAFSGARRFGKRRVGVSACAVFACAALYKRTCAVGSKSNNTNVIFEKISITANYTNTTQFPIILTTGSQIPPHNFRFETNIKEIENEVTLEVVDAKDLLNFGIFSRDYSIDSEDFVMVEDEYLTFTDEMKELFDYLWIRLRILIFVVSIYFLEMM